MEIKIKTVDNIIELFHSDNFVISEIKDFRPEIISVEVFSGGKRIAKRKRLFPTIYKRFIFPLPRIQKIVTENKKVRDEWNQKELTKEHE
jgi:hypothetical protein